VCRFLFEKTFKKEHKGISLGGTLTTILKNNHLKETDILVLPNGIAKTWIRSDVYDDNHETIKSLFVGSNEKRKRLSLFLDALSEKIAKNLNLSIVVPLDEYQYKHKTNMNWLGAVNNKIS
jgi:hypothetical protein